MRVAMPTKLAVSDKPTRLTPSEVIFFNAQTFAGKGDLSLSHLPLKVSGRQLGQTMLMAALLAAEEVGDIRLELRPVKGLFNRETLSLFVMPLETRYQWPADTLETRFYPLVKAKVAKTGSCQVDSLIYDLLGLDVQAPWQRIVGLVENGLATRGFLEVEEPKRFPKLMLRPYVLPVKTRFLLKRQPPEPVKRLLAQCQEDRPAVWDHLQTQITRGLKRCTEPPL